MSHSTISNLVFLAAMTASAASTAAESPLQARISEADANGLHACFSAAAATAVGSMLRVERHSMESRPPKSVATAQVTAMGQAKVAQLDKDGCLVATLSEGHASRGDWLVIERQ